MATQIFGQVLHRGISLLRTFLQRLEQDVVEIAGKLARQRTRGARIARRRGRFGRATRAVTGTRVGIGSCSVVAVQRQARGAARLRLQDRCFHLGRTAAPQAIRSGPRQQLIQHYAQGVDVGLGADRFAAHLLGRRVVELVGARADASECWRPDSFSRSSSLRCEIEQAHLAPADQDVRWFQIAMHTRRACAIGDRRTDLQEQFIRCLRSQPPRVACAVSDSPSTYSRPGTAVARVDARIEQARDIRMRELREDLPLAREARLQLGAGAFDPQQLERDRAPIHPSARIASRLSPCRLRPARAAVRRGRCGHPRRERGHRSRQAPAQVVRAGNHRARHRGRAACATGSRRQGRSAQGRRDARHAPRVRGRATGRAAARVGPSAPRP